MKPLIEFKLKHTVRSYDDTEKAYTLYDLKIAEEIDGYQQTMFYKQVRYTLYIKWLGVDCWVIDDYGNKTFWFSLNHIVKEAKLDMQEVEEIKTILNLFKNDMYRYINKNKSMKEWLECEDIHVTI
ncbi:hypothetical protein [Veillonella sp. CHU110]|uniref:hypothetical protein n=1 Tax=Veillonella sp. CHU110 TaxID=2490947 RepID=UPI000F8D89BD|nr:hypothetical protein [Veillonella sp. CHU110]